MTYGYYDLPNSYRTQAKCADCDFLSRTNTKKDYYGKTKYYCSKCRDYKKMDDDICTDVKIPESAYKKLGTYRQSGCYITTMMCEILGYDDDCEILVTMRAFRDNFLKLNIEYIPILLEYDQVGPRICDELRKDKNNYRIALDAMKSFLLPCAQAYKNGNPLEALDMYQTMISKLKELYNLESFMVNINAEYDINTVGKGRILEKAVEI